MANAPTLEESQRMLALQQSKFSDKKFQHEIARQTKTDYPTWNAASQAQANYQMDSLRQNQGTPEQSLSNQAREQEKTNRLSSRLNQLREMRKSYVNQLTASPAVAAIEAANQAWARQVDIWQSALCAGVWGFDVVVSDWLFLLIWFARMISPLLPKPRGLKIVPSYTLKTMSGIGVAISHGATALFAFLCYLVIALFIGVIVWFVQAIINGSFWEKVQTIYYLQTGPMSVLFELIKGAL